MQKLALDILYESRGNDDSRTKVSCKEVDVDWYLEPWDACCNHREESGCRRDDEDDEQRRDARSQLPIILILTQREEASHHSRVNSGEVDIGRVEVVGRGVCHDGDGDGDGDDDEELEGTTQRGLDANEYETKTSILGSIAVAAPFMASWEWLCARESDGYPAG